VRVVHIIQNFAPLVGGAERQLLAVAPLLQHAGIDVQVITRHHPGLLRREVVAGIPVHRMGSPGHGAGSLAFTASAQRLLRKLDPTVIHAYELLSPTTTAVLAKRHLNVPVVAKVLGGGELTALRGRPLGEHRLQMYLRAIDRFHVVSTEIDDLLAAQGVSARDRVWLPNGVDLQSFRPPTVIERQRARARWSLPTEALAVVFVGRLSSEKGLADLLLAWPGVRGRLPAAQLLVAGTGPDAAVLRQRLPSGCELIGHVDDVPELLRAGDAFVLPSHREGASNALLEAFASGLPAVATAVGGSVEMSARGLRAVLVPPAAPQALATALLSTLQDVGPARRRADRAREWVVAERSMQAVASSLCALYESLLRPDPPARPAVTT
jgi:glycosyltransferase involved in cell wall biosynthesis